MRTMRQDAMGRYARNAMKAPEPGRVVKVPERCCPAGYRMLPPQLPHLARRW